MFKCSFIDVRYPDNDNSSAAAIDNCKTIQSYLLSGIFGLTHAILCLLHRYLLEYLHVISVIIQNVIV